MIKMSSTTRSSKNLLLSTNIAEINEIAIGGDSDCEDKIVKKNS